MNRDTIKAIEGFGPEFRRYFPETQELMDARDSMDTLTLFTTRVGGGALLGVGAGLAGGPLAPVTVTVGAIVGGFIGFAAFAAEWVFSLGDKDEKKNLTQQQMAGRVLDYYANKENLRRDRDANLEKIKLDTDERVKGLERRLGKERAGQVLRLKNLDAKQRQIGSALEGLRVQRILRRNQLLNNVAHTASAHFQMAKYIQKQKSFNIESLAQAARSYDTAQDIAYAGRERSVSEYMLARSGRVAGLDATSNTQLSIARSLASYGKLQESVAKFEDNMRLRAQAYQRQILEHEKRGEALDYQQDRAAKKFKFERAQQDTSWQILSDKLDRQKEQLVLASILNHETREILGSEMAKMDSFTRYMIANALTRGRLARENIHRAAEFKEGALSRDLHHNLRAYKMGNLDQLIQSRERGFDKVWDLGASAVGKYIKHSGGGSPGLDDAQLGALTDFNYISGYSQRTPYGYTAEYDWGL